MATPKTTEHVRQFLEALETPSRALTKWEEGFLDTLRDRFDRPGAGLSDREFEILERIYAEKTD